MASEDAVYRESSQFRLWSFSPSQLANLRAQTNAIAQASISSRRGDAAADTATATATATAAAPAAPIQYLTPPEERMLLDFYTVELLRAGQFTGQPTDVTSTAAVFFRRFYVTHSIMTYPPAALFKTALFFGAKAEGYYHKLDGFAEQFPHTTAADILAGEFLLCQGIRFAFDVKHPFRALEGAIMQLRGPETTEGGGGGGAPPHDDDDRITAAHRRARAILKFSPLVTDAYFHYTPSQIMLAALWLADQGLVDRLLQQTFRRPPGLAGGGSSGTAAEGGTTTKKSKKDQRSEAEWERVNGPDVRDRVRATVEACSVLLATEPPERLTAYWGQPESNNLIKPLLKKLKACRDPDRMNLVALQKAKKEGAVKSYAPAHVALEEDGAVFGGNLSTKPAGQSANPDSAHEAKRRKVAKGLDDPFGPPLQR